MGTVASAPLVQVVKGPIPTIVCSHCIPLQHRHPVDLGVACRRITPIIVDNSPGVRVHQAHVLEVPGYVVSTVVQLKPMVVIDCRIVVVVVVFDMASVVVEGVHERVHRMSRNTAARLVNGLPNRRDVRIGHY